ncbi:MAG: hypothetical protein DRI57_10305 [Deltaproteobacteria bacterium]|nr:MAG: hypothetical protein DRI57_10305 [Deltaproteobacteria bacterium]
MLLKNIAPCKLNKRQSRANGFRTLMENGTGKGKKTKQNSVLEKWADEIIRRLPKLPKLRKSGAIRIRQQRPFRETEQMNQNKLLSDIKNSVISEYPSAKMIFYGSRSKGREKDWSDWDILILTDENLTENRKIELHNKIFEIELATGEIIHSVIHTKREWQDPLMRITPFYQNVAREGTVI